jgi:hypothetical protein
MLDVMCSLVVRIAITKSEIYIQNSATHQYCGKCTKDCNSKKPACDKQESKIQSIKCKNKHTFFLTQTNFSVFFILMQHQKRTKLYRFAKTD